MIHYIGFHGPKRVGKDYVASHLAEVLREHKLHTTIDRIARPLYEWAQAITGLPDEYLMGHEKDTPLKNSVNIPPELVGHSPRKILLDHGIWVRKTYGEQFLFNCLKARAESLSEDHDLWVMIADVRTDAEASLCDVVFEILREGYVYEGGVTESKLTVPVIDIHMKTNVFHPVHQFQEIFKQHLEPLIKN
jgi:hypothetical protein